MTKKQLKTELEIITQPILDAFNLTYVTVDDCRPIGVKVYVKVKPTKEIENNLKNELLGLGWILVFVEETKKYSDDVGNFTLIKIKDISTL